MANSGKEDALMKEVRELPASIRKDDFYKSLNLSERTALNYRIAIQSSFLTGFLKDELGTLNLFEIVDLNVLWDLYSKINQHPKNIKNHRAYSAAIMKYIKFLNNGQKLGKRIDSGKPRKG